jgi:hypothetical protein
MLYELNDAMSGKKVIAPLPLLDFSNLPLDHLLGLLFENVDILPIFRGSQPDEEGDFYALNRFGDLVIFELTRSIESAEGHHRVINHSHQAYRWTFDYLQARYNAYCKANDKASKPLEEIHQKTFGLENPLLPLQFNAKQHLFLFANAEDDHLLEVIKSVDYLQGQDETTALIPYRIYDLHGKYHYDFFTVHYGRQRDRGRDLKGVLFDIDHGSYETGTWEGKEESRLYAYGGTRCFVDYFQHRDIVFFFQADRGIFAAAQVVGRSIGEGEGKQKYRAIDFLTPAPQRQSEAISYLSFDRVMQITGKSFFWSRGIKGPDLTKDETDKLLEELHPIKAYNN